MLRGRVLSILYLLVAVFAVVTVFRVHGINNLPSVESETISYNPNLEGVSVYTPSEYPNQMKCNLTTVNTIIRNMMQDYYTLEQDNSTGSLLDVVLANDDKQFRILYNRDTRDFLCLSNPFIENYIPMTYIFVEEDSE